jgi:hypothetical protein
VLWHRCTLTQMGILLVRSDRFNEFVAILHRSNT